MGVVVMVADQIGKKKKKKSNGSVLFVGQEIHKIDFKLDLIVTDV